MRQVLRRPTLARRTPKGQSPQAQVRPPFPHLPCLAHTDAGLRVKALREGAFTTEESQRAAGVGVDNRQRPPLRRADGSLNAEALLALPNRTAPSPMTDTVTEQLEAVRVS